MLVRTSLAMSRCCLEYYLLILCSKWLFKIFGNKDASVTVSNVFCVAYMFQPLDL